MGGHHSKQTVKTSTNVVTNALFKQTQTCIGMVDGINYIGVFGSGNVLNHIFQDLSITLDQKCVNCVTNKEDFQTKITNEIVQNLKDQEVARTAWMDSSGDDQKTDVSSSVTTNITTEVSQKCIATVSGMNVLVVHGSGNVIENATQKQSEQVVSECIQSTDQSIQTTNDISNNVNQYSQYTSKNPLAFITDAIEAMLKNLMVIAAVVFIAIVVLVLVFEVAKGRHKGAGTGTTVIIPPTALPGAPTRVQ